MNTAVAVDEELDPVERLANIEAESIRRHHRFNPSKWVHDKLGDTLWSAQRAIMESVRDNRKTAVASCHEIGKSYIAGTIAGWWLDIWPIGEAFVVTSAPTNPQVRAILWREIGRVHSRGNLEGRVNQTEWWMKPAGSKEELVAFGRKPNEFEPTSFQGIHAPHVLYIFDEACGIPEPLWEAADSLIANDGGRALVIGNPDDPLAYFRQVCRPGSGWKVHHIGAFDSPNFTGEALPPKVRGQLIGRVYVEEKRQKWARTWYWVDRNGQRTEDVAKGVRVVCPEGEDDYKTNPFWQSKVLGRFPKVGTEQSLIPVDWITRAQRAVLSTEGPNELGVDVGGGGDSSTIAHRTGQRVRVIHEDHNPDTMETCGNVVNKLEVTGASVAKIDMIGIGRGVVDRGKELGLPFLGINVGEKAQDIESEFDEDEVKSGFVNLRSELWWHVRTLFERGEIDIDENDEELAGELAEIRFKRTSTGKIQIESKADAKKRDVPSPNRADAVMLSLAPIEDDGASEATW